MWRTKVFKTREAMQAWLDANAGRIRWEEIAVNNAWGVLYCPLRRAF